MRRIVCGFGCDFVVYERISVAKMSGTKTPRSIVVPKDATPEQVRDIYDDFARTYDRVRSYMRYYVHVPIVQ